MNKYVTGEIIKKLREGKKITQSELAESLHVSDKAVSKWETGKSYPDITLLEPLAGELGVSVAELLSGQEIVNANRAGNMLRSKVYVCPICGNAINSTGEANTSCCGVSLVPLEDEPAEDEHGILVRIVEDELFVSVEHEMTRQHYISFIAYLCGDSYSMVKLYPEQSAEARFRIAGAGKIFCYCNRDGLFSRMVNPGKL